MDAKLIVVGGKANKSEVSLKLPSTIGRSRSADLTVAHPKVSRQHCELFERDGMLVVRDNGSLNGTFVEDNRISEAVLEPGQRLTVGPLTFVAAYEPATNGEATPTLGLAGMNGAGEPVAFVAPAIVPPSEPGLELPGFDGDDPDAEWAPPLDADPADLLPPEATAASADHVNRDVVVPPTVAFSTPDELPASASSPRGEAMRHIDPAEMMETVPVEPEMERRLPSIAQASDQTVQLSSPTVEITEHRHLTVDEESRMVESQSRPVTDENHFAVPSDQAADHDPEFANSGGPFDPTDLGSELIGDDVPFEESPPAQPDPRFSETESSERLQETLETPIQSAPMAGESPSASDVAKSSQGEGLPGVTRKKSRTRWWPFGGKQGSSKNDAAPQPDLGSAASDQAASVPPGEPSSLHSEFLPPVDASADSTLPSSDSAAPASEEPSSGSHAEKKGMDEDELDQFLKSLGD